MCCGTPNDKQTLKFQASALSENTVAVSNKVHTLRLPGFGHGMFMVADGWTKVGHHHHQQACVLEVDSSLSSPCLINLECRPSSFLMQTNTASGHIISRKV